jgi:hypothetical protein
MLKSFIRLLAWEALNPILLRHRRDRIYSWNPAWHGLNLGCGLDLLPDWVGIDGGVSVLFRRFPSLVHVWRTGKAFSICWFVDIVEQFYPRGGMIDREKLNSWISDGTVYLW